MIEQIKLKHKIGRDIVAYLASHEYARFSDMRPKGVDTNLFSYHLKLLAGADLINKTELGYTLSDKGRLYVSRLDSDGYKLRSGPSIVVMLLIQDGYGNTLLQKVRQQPHIGRWSLPTSDFRIDDVSVAEAGRRTASDKLGLNPKDLRHVGDCYIVSASKDKPRTRTLVHLLRFEIDALPAGDTLRWVSPHKLASAELAPGIEQIISRAFFNDPFFFEEFVVDLR